MTDSCEPSHTVYCRYSVSVALDGGCSYHPYCLAPSFEDESDISQADRLRESTSHGEGHVTIVRGEVVDTPYGASPYCAIFRIDGHKLFEWQVSSVSEGRARIHAALDFLRERLAEYSDGATPALH